MRLYLECSMGASGDMLMAALYELLHDRGAFREKMESLGLPGVTFKYSAAKKCGITGTHITVKVGGKEEISDDVHSHGAKGDGGGGKHKHESGHTRSSRHYNYTEVRELIAGLSLPDNVLENALGVYAKIGEAEASVHSVPPEKLHLHEVGSLDAVADIVGCCILVNMLGVTDITASPVHVGSGTVRCEHGIMPVPAPAAAEILKGVPIYGGGINGELCTPTGAALLKHFVTRFGEMPPMTVSKIGYGMGSKDFEAANCLRAYLCEDSIYDDGGRDRVFEISCNLDDMTPEAVGAAFELLLESGALDVFAAPIYMKKNRPGIMLSCLCAPDERDKFSRLLLTHTTTLGVRVKSCRRDIMARSNGTVLTKYGEIRVKTASGYSVYKRKPEYDDVKAAAAAHGVPFMTVYDAALAAK